METEKDYNVIVKAILWFGIVGGGIRAITSSISTILFNPALGYTALALSVVGIVSLYLILTKKIIGFYIWVIYMFTSAVINDSLSMHDDHLYLLFALIAIILMCLLLLIKKDGVSAWDILLKKEKTK